MNFEDFDLPTQESNLAQRQAVLNALLARQMKGTETFGEAVSSLFGKSPEQRYQQQMEAFQRDNQTFQQRRQGQLGQELEAFSQRMNGSPSQPPAPYGDTGSAYGPPTEAVAPNPREAVIRAMTSQLPEVQAMGKNMLPSLYTKPQIKEHIIGNQLVRSTGAGPVEVAGTFNKADWKDAPRNVEGKSVMGQQNQQTGEWKPYQTPGTVVNVGDKGPAKLQDISIESMKTAREAAGPALRQIESATSILKALDDPQTLTGFGADVASGFMALGAKLGFNPGESSAKTQALMSELSKNTLQNVQYLKGATSDKDIAFLKDAALGKVSYDAPAIARVASLAYAAGHNALMETTEQWQGAKQVSGIQGIEHALPYPKVSYDASISDRKGFKMSDHGRLSYEGVPTAVKPSKTLNGRRVISLQDFLAEGQ